MTAGSAHHERARVHGEENGEKNARPERFLSEAAGAAGPVRRGLAEPPRLT